MVVCGTERWNVCVSVCVSVCVCVCVCVCESCVGAERRALWERCVEYYGMEVPHPSHVSRYGATCTLLLASCVLFRYKP